MTLLLPAVSRSRQNTQQTQCVNNLRQVGLGLVQFAGENNSYPLFINPEGRQGRYMEHSGNWVSALNQHGLDVRVWHCPAAIPPATTNASGGNYPRRYYDYGYNAFGLSGRGSLDSLGLGGHKGDQGYDGPIRPFTPPVREPEVVSPGEMLAVGDGFEGQNGTLRDGRFALWRVRVKLNEFDAPGSTPRCYARHRAKVSVIFCDAHAESKTIKALFNATNNTALVQWNRDHEPHRDRL